MKLILSKLSTIRPSTSCEVSNSSESLLMAQGVKKFLIVSTCRISPLFAEDNPQRLSTMESMQVRSHAAYI